MTDGILAGHPFIFLYFCSHGLPTLYHVGDEKEAEAIMVPVASTVIPLDDLPEFKVGLGFGINEKEKVKPS